MEIVDFAAEHVAAAMQLALDAYVAERVHVPDLPHIGATPNVEGFAHNGRGVAAVQDGELLGFMCWYAPRPNFWLTTTANGVYIPLHGHGTVKEGRERIYSKLFQGAVERTPEPGSAHLRRIRLRPRRGGETGALL